MLDIPFNRKLFQLYVSVIDTKARVLQLAKESQFSEYLSPLMAEVSRLDEIKGKIEAIIDFEDKGGHK